MAETIGKAVVEVTADTREAMASIERLQRAVDRAGGRRRLSWPDVGAFAVILGFVGFVVERLTG